ncbi:hypothetical protein GWK48_02335 [Metallosphaera tengchongensis]|uniref:Uncharacterized protein n=1 Tax=Metallosphaera tengchongensis TaxID=1532350 RepID=A0A6N0NT75_9CREN|nr:hypothetical protein [Metallosphaera tengchongensis]QKQ99384.1 hypothetical protein GWK48_02335 [Metallosphaera tengchongensis]
MPYILNGRICKPNEVKRVERGDIVIVKPVSVLVNGRYMVFPPLSLVSDQCPHVIGSSVWVDGVSVAEDVDIVTSTEEVEGELEVLSHEFLPAFVAKRILGTTKFKTSKVEGIPIVTVKSKPIISLKGTRILLTDSRTTLLLLSHSLKYYTSSQDYLFV